MRARIGFGLVCGLLACAAGSGAGRGAAEPEKKASLAQLAWMAGAWAGETRFGKIEEQFNAPAGGTMLGTSRIVRDGKTVHREFILIEEGADGVTMTVHLPNRQPVPFRLVESSATEAVFANPQNPMPNKIRYRRMGENLTARIEGEVNGRAASEEFPMKRAGER